jgi:hypothetical protein
MRKNDEVLLIIQYIPPGNVGEGKVWPDAAKEHWAIATSFGVSSDHVGVIECVEEQWRVDGTRRSLLVIEPYASTNIPIRFHFNVG